MTVGLRRQEHLERCPLPDLTLHGEKPAVRFHDAKYCGKTESRPLSRLLGGKELIEDAIHHIRRHARSCVADSKNDMRTVDRSRVRAREVFVDLCVLGGER